MVLTSESRRLRWLILVPIWAVAATLALLHSQAFRGYIDLLSNAAPRTPPIQTPMQRIVPTNYADAQTWVRYALDFDQGSPWRVRYTDKDNAPTGREVHWNSGFAHLVALAGKIQAAVTGQPPPRATEEALAWFNLPLLIGVIIGFSLWAAHRAGAGAGALVALGIIGTEAFYAGFAPSYVDHHGVLTAAAFGLVLGAVFMGAGWWQAGEAAAGRLLPDSLAQARRAAVTSATCGAIGMWFSAASTIPAIGLVGAAGLLAVWTCGRSAQAGGARFEPSLWRWWGRTGAAVSIAFYLLEYAPGHLGLRMEVNHPFYALAWWGGAELVALLAERHLAGPGGRAWPWRSAIAPVLALAAAPVTIALGGVRVFVVSDPFVAKVPETVAEGISLFKTQQIFGWPTFFSYAGWNLLPLPAAAVLLLVGRERIKPMVVFAGVIATSFVILLFSQVRWSLGASGPVLCLLLVTTAAALQDARPRTRWLTLTAIAGLLLLPVAVRRINSVHRAVAARQPDRMDVQQILYRDVAAAIRGSQPKGDIVLLASPNASCAMGYYGGFKTIGTLYWENYMGMRAAAEIFSAPDEATARRLIQARGITHLAMISEENFLQQFFTILHPEKSPEDLRTTFGYQLLVSQVLPTWLRPIPYRPPIDASLPDLRVLLLQVVPNQTSAEALWHIARTQVALGELPNALQTFRRAAESAPANDRSALLLAAGNTCYDLGAHALAADLYRLAMSPDGNPVAAANLAWLLATSGDARVRNGAEAMALIQPLIEAAPNDLARLNSYAAALAETGRFAEALAAGIRARELATQSADATALRELSVRVEEYRAGRPLRR